jgi:nucleoside 2-deoxyribosyltransferase
VIVAGGVYREECIAPAWSRIFGSGGRAAVALSSLSAEVSLHAYAASQWVDDVRASFNSFGINSHLCPISSEIGFSYFHPMSSAKLMGTLTAPEAPLEVRGSAVLRFGFVEGSAIVHAHRAVFDPQSADEALRFRENGSRANQLAIVLNEAELQDSTAMIGLSAVHLLRERNGADLVVVKMGARGAQVYAGDDVFMVPAYISDEVFKIGSGDIFSAVFAHYWAERAESPLDAAFAASQAVARYVTTRDAQCVSSQINIGPPAKSDGPVGPVYLAAPFFNLAQRWMVEEARAALMTLDASVFSPLHDVGIGGTSAEIAGADLAGLRDCRSVLAIIDGEDAGTLFEVGYARDRGIPVVALAESPRPETLTMLEGSGCRITRDFTTAVYHAVWAALT